jgi:hypothetical protein
MRSCHHRAALIPNNLLMMQEADLQQAIEDLTSKFRGVPDIADFTAVRL